ncbi:hypothetical protein E3N88_06188 [Mikania micrantha]|uniref:Integrase catalytic domain-containing protein n=1 Tax=Mikania micrantha TaxID=192012 RepID=A0A5N6PNX7_9ASTR|nr:hypothetical protein E3N88_06188 [Mikania micrantha]
MKKKVDDYSRRVWVYVLKNKHETFSKFKEWNVLVENQTGNKVKKLRTDNGLEFCNKDFSQLCKLEGFARHLSVPGNPQQNGIVERMNRTLLNKVRCLLSNSGLPKRFWAEALNTSAYLINRSPSSTIGMLTPMEKWSGSKADYSVLRVFGFVAYAHVRSKVIVSRDVSVFREDVMYKDVMEAGKYAEDKAQQADEVRLEVELFSEEHDKEKEVIQLSNGASSSNMSSDYNLVRDLPRRQIIPPARYRNNEDLSAFLFTAAEMESVYEPITFHEAISCEERDCWIKAMQEEMDSLIQNETWELVDKHDDQRLVKCKWIFKIKEGLSGEVPIYKARLVAKGFTQKAGIDYNEIFSPVVKHISIRVILALTAVNDFELEQLDVKTAFLHGYLDEKIYMVQPLGFEVEEHKRKMCLLKRSLYGLKQSPRQWYQRFDDYIVSHDFSRSKYDSCVYFQEYNSGEFLYLLLYVDDILVACKDKLQITAVKQLLMREFDMKELGDAKKILGMEIYRDRSLGKLVVTHIGNQFKLSKLDSPTADEEIEKMQNVPYSSAVESLMYLMVCTRPDLGYAVGLVSRYLCNPGKNHWEAVKWIFRYLNGTKDVGLIFGQESDADSNVYGYVDADFAKDLDRGRSNTGYIFKVFSGVVSWKSTLQHIVALTTTESEYIALTEAVK